MSSTTFQSETGALRRVMMKHPYAAVGSQEAADAQWEELNWLSHPDYRNMCAEANALHDLLRSRGIEVIELPADDETGMDSLYARDASIVTDRGAVLCAMGKEQRAGEPAAQAAAYARLGMPVLGRIEGDGRVEGGDCLWLDTETFVIGRGYRTNAEGVRQIRALLEPDVTVLEVPAPHFRGPGDVFHLMSMISPVDARAAVVYSPTMPVPFREYLLERGTTLIEVPESEYDRLGPNVLALAPGVALVAAGAPRTAELIRKAGVEVIEFAGDDLCVKGCGGPTCLTRTLEREA